MIRFDIDKIIQGVEEKYTYLNHKMSATSIQKADIDNKLERVSKKYLK